MGSNECWDSGSNSLSLHCPHQATSAIKCDHESAELLRGAPLPGLYQHRDHCRHDGGTRCCFLTLRGQNSLNAFEMNRTHSGRCQGKRCLRCHARRAERFCFTVPGPVFPNPSHINNRMSSSDAGRVFIRKTSKTRVS